MSAPSSICAARARSRRGARARARVARVPPRERRAPPVRAGRVGRGHRAPPRRPVPARRRGRRGELRRALALIADEGSGPLVLHGASGRDRTGVLAALVLLLLGVDEDTVVDDFTRTGPARDRTPAARHAAQAAAAIPRATPPGRAPAQAMRLFLAALAQRHGSVRAYAAERLGADNALVARLRHALLERPVDTLCFRRADAADVPVLVRLRDEAARWQIGRGIAQWKPGELGEDHFRARLEDSEVWIATLGPEGPVAGAFELWWEDLAAWGPQPPVAGYVHRLMTDRQVAPAGTGRRMLAHAERRILAAGRTLCRLDCRANNPRLRAFYASAGYQVRGEHPFRDGGPAGRFAATLLERRLTSDVVAPPALAGTPLEATAATATP
ncbi:GNAT family N-acetyltransferase [Streptomyces sp. G45]|uniref:GNAT family N-acetyltransferase n=1 Tax=Streptomyces sp. G45 TaxID=3406627 RepID=UPI003C296C3D